MGLRYLAYEYTRWAWKKPLPHGMVALGGQESTRLGSMDLNLFSSNQGARYLSIFYIVAVETGNYLFFFHSNQNQYILFVVALS